MSPSRLALVGIAAALLLGCSAGPRAPEAPVGTSQATLVILHTNDLHGQLEPWTGWEGALTGKRMGGFDRLAAVVRKVRQEVGESNVLLLDAGGAIGGSMIADATQGQAVLQMMRGLRYDAMALGESEADFSAEVLARYAADDRLPMLGANVRSRTTGRPLGPPFLIRQVAGVRVGILGLGYPNTPLTTVAKNVEDVEYVRDSVGTVQEALEQMRDQGAQVVVVLSHLGLEADRELAAQVDGINVIVGGHSHNRLSRRLVVNGAEIVQAGAFGSDVGRVDLTVEGRQAITYDRRLIPLDNAVVSADADTARALASLLGPYRPALDRVVGRASSPIVRAQTLLGQEPIRRDAQSPADSLFADILRSETHSEIALLPGVEYGVAIQPGPITASALRSLIPDRFRVVTVTMRGEEVRQVLEQSLENLLADNPVRRVGGIIQVSGLRWIYDPNAAEGQRVLSVEVQGRPLDSSQRYAVVTNSLLAGGGDNYRQFSAGQERHEWGGEYEMVRTWLERAGPVAAPTDARTIAIAPALARR
ncbi:MAG TPA: bifunctional UDP-sugar hydrolase/5'-nucleotidase [Candidatus Sulfotelmatobacter sp.]|nr:bifunctional UDP-sugar hydrolase/5'-nucleotidase [Candidatus Sulfotelmatobacter sp.]